VCVSSEVEEKRGVLQGVVGEKEVKEGRDIRISS
jgi:hypothetical protein